MRREEYASCGKHYVENMKWFVEVIEGGISMFQLASYAESEEME